jgi:hypothetical protein
MANSGGGRRSTVTDPFLPVANVRSPEVEPPSLHQLGVICKRELPLRKPVLGGFVTATNFRCYDRGHPKA